MKHLLTPQFFFFFIISIFCITYIAPVYSQFKCLEDQKILLLELKDEFSFNSSASRKLVQWNENKDCCSWDGVGCDTAGHIISLELDHESIFAGLENSTSLYSLQYLEKLNLAFNCFNRIQIPRRLSNLANLTHLNLSDSCFYGQVPVELSAMRGLVSLDLSNLNAGFHIPDLKRLVQNLTELRTLYLDGVNISIKGNDWCRVLSSFLPNLRELSLVQCGLFGPIDSSLSQLHSLSVLRLDWNPLSTTVPDFFANFSKLTTLSLSYCLLQGLFPSKIFQLPTLQNLDLAYNFDLSGTLPQFLPTSSLRTMVLSYTNFSRSLPDSINNLIMLSRIELSNCKFSGPIPSTITNLTELLYLDLSFNNLTGLIPEFHMSKKLTHIDLSFNRLSGPLSSAHFEGLSNLGYIGLASNLLTGNLPSFLFVLPSLQKLVLNYNQFDGQIEELPNPVSSQLNVLDLSTNNLQGNIPSSLFVLPFLQNLFLYNNQFDGQIEEHPNPESSQLNILDLSSNNLQGNLPSSLFLFPSLQNLLLSNNQFDGQIAEIPNPVSSQLNTLDLSSNNLQGPIPKFFFKFQQLQTLSLSFNFFNGTLDLDMMRDSRNLTTLEVSHNNLSMFSSSNGNSTFSTSLDKLDLSANKLKGEIPTRFWGMTNGLRYLNLSFNQLTGFQNPYTIPIINTLDLSSNQLRGELPIPPSLATYLEYSNNNFNALPEDIGNYISRARFFSLSNNSLTGEIPKSICNTSYLEVLDLSNNALNGSMPSCLTESNGRLGVLNLQRNMLSGNIPDTFSIGCSLKSLDLSQNFMTGRFPNSLVNCPYLEVLNIGNNSVEDTFPCMLMNTSLRVLVLRSNSFYGDLYCPGATQEWTNIQIIDLSVNKFTGDLSPSYFSNWKGMMNSNYNQQLDLRYKTADDHYIQATVMVIIKGQQMELQKILIVFTSIDFSSNKFEGNIPGSIVDLNSLYFLNLSSNAFKGTIPASIGNMKQLESLDLSMNHLTGKIPGELASLTFLAFFNLSFNKLSGSIPLGRQLQTFSADSYEGNAGLCGFPLNISCNPNIPPPKFENRRFHGKTDIDWNYIFASLGFTTGLGIFVLPLLFFPNWRERYFDQVDQVLLKIFHQQKGRKRRTGARVPRNQIRRL
ncbi:receptor like protein 33 [Forsythia ovata]|uniref:Receptor like protein 33 n=1 Tax=Forsythia ovata TaxID=205694 RepID=A0ABD1SIN3_9LAMI